MQPFNNMRVWASLMLAFSVLAARAEPESLFRNHQLPGGSSMEVLPQGAILHVQFSNLYQSLTNLEQLAKSAVPAKAVSTNYQQLLQTEHPLMTLIGAQTIQEPLTEEKVLQKFGVDPQKPVSLTLYLGDPRRMFILTVPAANSAVFGGFMTNQLHPKVCEEVSLADKAAVRLGFGGNDPIKELFVVFSERNAFICGDRSLALALHNTPVNQRLNQDAFMRQVNDRIAGQEFSLVFNPGLIKTVLVQIQQLRSLAIPLLQAQRGRLLKELKPEARMPLEIQLRKHFGVKDLNEFVDYVECVVIATYQAMGDELAKHLIAFEGISVTASLNPAYPQIAANIYSQEFQPEKAARPIPVAEVRQAVSWLGKDIYCFSATGREPQAQGPVCLSAWLKQMKTLMDAKGLRTGFLDKVMELVQNQPASQPIGAKAAWILTARAPLNPPPAIKDFQSLEKYGQALSTQLTLPIRRPVRVVPGVGTDFLESWLKEEVATLNQRDKAARQFWLDVAGKKGWYDYASRYQGAGPDSGIKKFTLENAYTTHHGWFGYDEHELVNRRVYAAREWNGYLVYHQGVRNTAWLSHLSKDSDAGLSAATAKLLDRVPEGANYFAIHQVLAQLPGAIDWLVAVENLAHTDLQAYLARAGEIMRETPKIEEAKQKLGALKMPELVYALNRDPQSGALYCLLPGGVAFPRSKVLPVLRDLTSEFSAKADQFGGGLVYTRVRPGVYECAAVQSAEALSCLISTVANKMTANYLGTPENQKKLQKTVMTERDGDPERYDQILVKNPAWEFLPTPKPHQPAKAPRKMPKRDTNAPPNLIDLSAYYNAGLAQSWHAGGLANNTLKNLPQGVQELGGVKFDVRGIVQLSGKDALAQLEVKFPKEVKGIKVNRKAERVHFLHATAWIAPDDTKIGAYIVRYTDGQTQEIPIVYGKDVRDWWTQPNESANDQPVVAWSGKNTARPEDGPAVRLFKTSWTNPRPETEIQSLDYRTEMTSSAPFLIALTVE